MNCGCSCLMLACVFFPGSLLCPELCTCCIGEHDNTASCACTRERNEQRVVSVMCRLHQPQQRSQQVGRRRLCLCAWTCGCRRGDLRARHSNRVKSSWRADMQSSCAASPVLDKDVVCAIEPACAGLRAQVGAKSRFGAVASLAC